MAKKKDDLSIINEGLTIDGTVSSDGKMIVKGIIKGTLLGDTVIIGEEGAVYAETQASHVTIGGKFQGNIKVSNELIILSTGNCGGVVECGEFVVEPGGVLNASVTCLKAKPEEIKKPETLQKTQASKKEQMEKPQNKNSATTGK